MASYIFFREVQGPNTRFCGDFLNRINGEKVAGTLVSKSCQNLVFLMQLSGSLDCFAGESVPFRVGFFSDNAIQPVKGATGYDLMYVQIPCN